ncbi:tumor necrosis factor ligand superfamily member 12 [Heterodontus francisci]|uniref:tumor necrosis factor ligand superfamily member 12 n=1 Tax=Heterodontus francisci TaxID=7792 RepID=UPI00355AF4E5
MRRVGAMALARRSRWKMRLGFLMLLIAAALSLATFSLAVAALSWVECRNLSRSPQVWENNLQKQGAKSTLQENIHPDLSRDTGSPRGRLGFLQGLLESQRLTQLRRKRRRASGGKNKLPIAAHFEVMPTADDGIYLVEKSGIIRQWSERQLRVKSPLQYNNKTGDFTVRKDGVYFLYSQVHCDDNTTAYLKLDVKVDNLVTFKCLQGLPPTPLYGQQLTVHSCQASGLVRLMKESRIAIYSIAGVRLKTKTFTYFGLFKL